MEPTQLRTEVNRGVEAAQLLENRLLADALEAIEAEIISQWGECPARDVEGRELIWQLYKTTKKFRGMLTGYIETGKLAKESLRRLEEGSVRERALRAIRSY